LKTLYQHEIRLANSKDVAELLPLVRAYHEFEHVALTDAERAAAVGPLLTDPSLGRIWLIASESRPVGYMAVCFGYSIEFKGKDAYMDEFFIERPWRGKGIGGAALSVVCKELAGIQIKALHLEVRRDNLRAKSFYAASGFKSREQFHLMTRSL